MSQVQPPSSPPQPSQDEMIRGLGWRIGFWLGRSVRIVLRLVLLVSVLLLLATLALQIPAVQNWAARKLSAEVSNILGTEFSVGHIALVPFSELALEDVYLLDQRGDTLLRTELLEVQMFQPIRSLINRQLMLESVHLDGARLRLRRDSALSAGNWDYLIDALGLRQNPDGPPNPNPFAFDLRQVEIHNTSLSFLDSLSGTGVEGRLDTFELQVDLLDIPSKRVLAEYLIGAGLQLDIKRWNSAVGKPGQELTIDPTLPATDSAGLVSILPDFFIELPRLDLRRNNISYHDARQPAKEKGVFDPAHIEVRNFTLLADDIDLSPDSLGLSLQHLGFRESRSDFKLQNFSAGTIALTNRKLILEDFELATPGSQIDGQLSVAVPIGSDWRSIAEEVRYELDLKDTKISIAELLTLVPDLEKIAGLRLYRDGHIEASGRVLGTRDRIKLDQLALDLPDGSRLRADASIRNLSNLKEAWLFIDVRELSTDVQRLKRWVPDLKIPEAFERLGKVQFAGEFTGFSTDFVAYGDVRTELGRATLDTRFVRRGEVPTYTGEAQLYDFDLGRFINNPDVGSLSASIDIREGRGLKRETLLLDVIGTVSELEYKGYTYHDVRLNGRLDPNGFAGQLNSSDPNADLSFDGSIDLREGQQKFSFNIDTRRLDLAALNLAQTPWRISGNIDVNSNSFQLDNLEGGIIADSLTLTHSDGREYNFTKLSARQAIAPDGDKRFIFDSPQVQFEMSGRYRLKTVLKELQVAFAKTYPDLYAQAGLPAVALSDSLSNVRISLDARLVSVDSVLQVFDIPVKGLDGASLTLSFDAEREDFDLSFSGVSPQVAGVQLKAFEFDLRGQSGELQLEGSTAELNFGKFGFSGVNIFSEYADGELRFGVSSDTTTRVLGEIKLGGTITLGDTAVTFVLDRSSHLDISGERWTIDQGNELVVGKRQLTAQNLVLRSGDRFVEVESVGQRGVNVLLRKFNLDLLNTYLNPDKLQIAGEVDAFFTASDIYAQDDITLGFTVDSLRVNGVDWGALQTLVTRADSTEAIVLYTTFTRQGQQAVIDASLATAPGQVIDGKARPRNYFDTRISSDNFDMSFLSYFIPGITGLQGKLGADLHVYGTPDDITPAGGVLIDDAAMTIDYLKTRYFIDSQFVSIDRRMLDATGRQIKDRFGNVAIINGGLLHDNLQNWKLDVSLNTRRLQVLNTGKRDNPLYYGDAFMAGRVAFSGPFNLTNIDIDATALSDTRVVFPVSGSSAESELRFIKFKQPSDSTQQTAATTLRGINMDMDIEVTPAAQLLLVFDEAAGDILRAQGSGDIDINIRRTGTYTMFGKYEISQGDYLFTLLNVVNKPFTILEGGTINWTGDPFSADLNLTAKYAGLNVAPASLISDFLVGRPELASLANTPTPIDLLMKLTGDLQRPNLAFEINLPDLQGELRNYVNSRLALVRQDENELNRQVFGLIVIGQFLPSFTDIQATSVGFNTISELFSNQLSYLLTELFTSLAGSNGALTGVDFDINLQNNTSLSGINGGSVGNDIQTRLRTYFLEDRLEIGLGVSVGQNGQNQGSLTAGRFEVSYAISDNRRLRLRTFIARNVDIANSNRTRAGIGLTWRREFDSFQELFGNLEPQQVRKKEEKVGVF